MPGEPTLLRALITGRHWQKFATFEAQFRRAAQELAEQQQEPALGKVTVSPRQWERWYAGRVKTAPYPDACRVLEHMFGYSVRQLLAPASQTAPPAPEREESRDPTIRNSGIRDSGEPPGAGSVAPTAPQPQPPALPAVAGEVAAAALPTASSPNVPNLIPPRDTLTPPRDTQPPDELAVLLCHLQTLTAIGPDDTLSARQRDDVFTRLVQFLTTWADTMNRRELLRMLGWATTAAMATPALTMLDAEEQERVARAIQAPSRVDETVIGHIEEVLQRCLRQDDTLGPQAALDTVLAQRSLVQAMLLESPSALRPRLLSVYSDLTRTTGWLSFDLNDFDSAWYYYEQARTAAHEAQNSALGAYVLSQMSHLATWERKPRVAIDHAVAAQRWAEHTDDARLQAYTFDVAARGYAIDDCPASRSRCRAELERAEARLAEGDTDSSILYFNTRAQLLQTQSRCLLQLADPAAAAAKAQESLDLRDGSFVRNRAFATLSLGRAQLQTGEVEQAAVVVGDAVELTARNRSARLLEELRAALRDLGQWHDDKSVQELFGRYHALIGHHDLGTLRTKGASHGFQA